MVRLADWECPKLRQNYNREAPRLASQSGRYAHAKQNRRMKKSLCPLRSRMGRVMRDIERRIESVNYEPADPMTVDDAQRTKDRKAWHL